MKDNNYHRAVSELAFEIRRASAEGSLDAYFDANPHLLEDPREAYQAWQKTISADEQKVWDALNEAHKEIVATYGVDPEDVNNDLFIQSLEQELLEHTNSAIPN